MSNTTHKATTVGLLDEEISFYEANRESFIRDHLNRHLLIKGKQLIATYETESAAIAYVVSGQSLSWSGFPAKKHLCSRCQH